MSTTEEKLDSLLNAVLDLKDSQQDSQRNLDIKLKKLEKDVAAAQDVTENALRKATRGRPMEFKQKGHQEEFEFNEQVEDHLEAASKKSRRSLLLGGQRLEEVPQGGTGRATGMYKHGRQKTETHQNY